ncbi:hypothetical protein IAT38_008259 [Cryptococcus sp. DSM 104549]
MDKQTHAYIRRHAPFDIQYNSWWTRLDTRAERLASTSSPTLTKAFSASPSGGLRAVYDPALNERLAKALQGKLLPDGPVPPEIQEEREELITTLLMSFMPPDAEDSVSDEQLDEYAAAENPCSDVLVCSSEDSITHHILMLGFFSPLDSVIKYGLPEELRGRWDQYPLPDLPSDQFSPVCAFTREEKIVAMVDVHLPASWSSVQERLLRHDEEDDEYDEDEDGIYKETPNHAEKRRVIDQQEKASGVKGMEEFLEILTAGGGIKLALVEEGTGDDKKQVVKVVDDAGVAVPNTDRWAITFARVIEHLTNNEITTFAITTYENWIPIELDKDLLRVGRPVPRTAGRSELGELELTPIMLGMAMVVPRDPPPPWTGTSSGAGEEAGEDKKRRAEENEGDVDEKNKKARH